MGRRPKRRLLEVGRGDRFVLMFAVAFGFVWVLRHSHLPTWLYVPALVAGWFVFVRFRWITGGRERAKDAIRELEESLRRRR
jgi:Flp pilus assembly protein TadB